MQYIWLWCLLIYNTIPLIELAQIWKYIFDPYEWKIVPFPDLKQTLILLSKSCQIFEVDFAHTKFSYIILDELRKANCLTSDNELISENLRLELMKETKLLLYLNNSLLKNVSLEVPLPVLWGQIGNVLNLK